MTGLEAGASWEYSLDGGSNWSTGDSSDNTFELADGSYDSDDVLVRQTDLAGNLSSNGALAAATIDTVAPAAPSVALVDAGSGGSTSDATVTISGLEADASWEYSTDSGSIWSTGDSSDNTFELADGSYATGQVAVRQTDVAGNVGLPTALTESFTVTTTAPTVVIFDFVTGKSSTVGGSRTFAADVDYEIYFIVSSVSASLVNVEQQWGGNLSLDANDKIIMLGDNNGVSAGGYGPVFHYRDTLSDLTAETVSRVDFAPYSSFYPMLAYRWETSEGDLGLALLTESFSGQYVVRQLSLLTEGVRRTVTGFSNPFKSTVNLNFGSGSLNRAQMSVVTTLPLFNISGSSYAWNGSALALTTPP